MQLRLSLLVVALSPMIAKSSRLRGRELDKSHSSSRSSKHSSKHSSKSKRESHYCPTGRDKSKKKEYHISPSSDTFAETSYMSYTSLKHEGHRVMWMGSDGAQNTISAVDLKTGKTVQRCKLDGISKSDADWESMSLGPCESKRRRGICVYVGNTGNNAAQSCDDRSCDEGRRNVYIYKFKEPSLSTKECVVKVTTLVLDYSDKGFPTNRADSEAMFVDWNGDRTPKGNKGDIYIVTKLMYDRDLQRLGKISVDQHADAKEGKEHKVELEAVGELSSKRGWNGADMARSGRLIALRDTKRVYFFARSKTQTVVEALQEDYCKFKSETAIGGDARQFEAVTMVGGDVAEASECFRKKPCRVKILLHNLLYS